MIKSYGEFWNPDIIEWTKSEMWGTAEKQYEDGMKTLEPNCWEQVGIYVLYDSYRPVYVGKSTAAMGRRLRVHYEEDRLAGRWDLFSWYGLRIVNKNSSLRAAEHRATTLDDVCSMLEALSIGLLTPPQNRKYEKLAGALEIQQKDALTERTVRSYLREIHKVAEKLDRQFPEDDAANPTA